MSTANMAIDAGKARAITDYVAANPDASNRDVAASLGVHESAVRRAKAARGVMVELGLSVIRTDGGTQFREAVNEDVALEYAEAYKAGDRLPAPVAFEDGNGDIWLGDGFTRLRAAGLAGLDRLEFELRQGSLDDAILYAAGANERHGQRRTKADRHRAIEAAIKLRPELSNRDLANICHVSHELVRQVRNRVDPKFELKPDPLPENQIIQNDKLVDEPYKPAKNQSVLPIGDGLDETPAEIYERQTEKTRRPADYDDDWTVSSTFNDAGAWMANIAGDHDYDEQPEIEVEETTADGGPVDQFAAWLASLPLNGKLQGASLTKFNDDARFYWEFTKSPAFKAFEQHIAKATKSRTAGLTFSAVDRFRKSLVHPRDWKLCAECSGSGSDPGLDRPKCQACWGRGYNA